MGYRARHSLITAFVALAGLSASGCSINFKALSRLASLNPNPSSVPAALTRISGDAQTGVVNTTLAQPLVVEVTDASALPVSGALVTFTITSGAGSVTTASMLTDVLGRAQTDWTLGTNSSLAHTIQVDSSSLPPVFFNATATPGPPLLVFTQQPTTGTAGTAFATQPITRLRDSFGNLISGSAPVTLSLYPTAVDCTNATNAIPNNLVATPSITGTNPTTTAAGLTTFTNIVVTRASPTATGVPGNVFLRASNGTQVACSTAIAMTHAAMNDITLTLDSSSDVVTDIAMTARAVDVYRNLVTNYTGTLAFTHPTGTTHGSDVLPANYTFVLGDAGQKSFVANLRRSNVSHLIRATDTVTPGYSGDTSSFILAAGPQSALSVTALTTPPTNVNTDTCSAGFDVCRVDTYGNLTAPASATTLNTITGRGQGNFYTDSGCSSATFNAPVILASSACRTIYFRDTFSESLTLNFQHASLTSTTSALSVDGIFYASHSISTSGEQSLDVALSDMNGDGRPDLIFSTGTGTQNIRIRLGTGAVAGAPPYFGANTQSVARVTSHNHAARIDVGDMDGDANNDVVALSFIPGSRVYVSVFKGDGAGNIGAEFYESDLGTPYIGNGATFRPDIKIIDINGDGANDVIITTQVDQKILFLKNDGTGVLTNVGNVDLGVGAETTELATGLIDGDAKRDFVVSVGGINQVRACINTTTALESNGALWSFDCTSSFSVSNNPDGIDLGDINGDGFLDIATALTYVNEIAVSFGNGTGAFGVPTNYSSHTWPASVKIADFDGDGLNDVYAACQASSRSTLRLNVGAGVLTTRSDYAISNSGGARIAKGLLNGAGDTKWDVVTGGWTSIGALISK